MIVLSKCNVQPITIIMYVIMLCAIWLLLVFQKNIGMLGYAVTKSLPYKFYWIKTTTKPQLEYGDLVAFKTNNRGAEYKGEMQVKIIGGKPNDIIDIQTISNIKYIFINDTQIGPVWARRRNGKPLYPIKNKFIPKNHYFVYTPHLFSFDSRYSELGLISEEEIIGKAYVIF